MRNNKNILFDFDWFLLVLYFLLVIMGFLTVYSVAFNPESPSIFSFSEKYGKQLMWILISLFCGSIIMLIDSEIFKKISIPIYLIVLALLVVVLFMPPINGARAWLGVGSLGIQPAEFAKISSSLLTAKYLSSINLKHQTNKNIFIAFGIIFTPMFLILLQPDAGTFLVFTSFLFVFYREGVSFDPLFLFIINRVPSINYKNTWVGVHFIPIAFCLAFLAVLSLLSSKFYVVFSFFSNYNFDGFLVLIFFLVILAVSFVLVVLKWGSRRNRKNYILAISLSAVLSIIFVSFVQFGFNKLASHQKNRIELFLGIKSDPDGQDYNRNRAMAAVGSGGFSGKGYKNASVSSVRTNHVPESETDFIFCPFAEEWGFLGSFVVICFFSLFVLRILYIAERQRSSFNRVYGYCIGMIFFYHFLINIGMNIGFAPIIGIPLPFFSCGGSSFISFTIMLFLLLKLDSQRMSVLS